MVKLCHFVVGNTVERLAVVLGGFVDYVFIQDPTVGGNWRPSLLTGCFLADARTHLSE